jgi:SsrA-binding protein
MYNTNIGIGINNYNLTALKAIRNFSDDKGWAKVRIALAKGKKIHDKRETIKDRENKRQLDRVKKGFRR